MFKDIIDYLQPGDCLVRNNTKVIPARLYGKKETGANVEFLLLNNQEGDIWECIVRPGNKLHVGTKVIFGEGLLTAEILEILPGGTRKVKFYYNGIFNEILDQIGLMPLPPYIHESLKDNDRYDDFYPIALKYQEFTDGSMYTLPLEYHVEMTWYNKEIFEENNVELPKTFDEFLDVCTTFQNAGVTPLAAGLKSWEPLLKSSMAFVTAEYLSTDEGKGFGEKYRNGEVTMDGTWNPYIETWSQLIDNGVYTADMTGIDHDQALEQFATGGSAMFCSGPWDYDAIMEKNPELQLDMMPFYGTKESAGWLIGGPGCGFAANASSKNLDAVKKVLAAISTTDGQNALWQNNQGGSSYLNGVEFDLPEAYTSVAGALAAGNVYCPWNEWGSAAGAHETYGTEMQSYLLGAQDLSTTLQTVDEVVSELLSK
mgnify:CR=1 FL=1